ncbi:nuclear GTPase SLIP-GC-like isoform X1 [Amphiprion ocellaris]|uniref:Dynamin N-terminal domain-containing protein n=1 Tax=Amphiprion ocellaris TaxID=80972 RepID=A0AAQ5YM68_AMPOC|nr:nuclear GTPase SLIP-GC-like isoform X1 [Amphiprion ocellaris]XP_054860872.1 nuclear GTPase SLIP-GC-like isoform X1 [Amphiprion ocellaris]XP_054860873.1 nuclear GTPase SLIP-GC-like isoform X1 [Amphiprion ocellaris]XP_054860874.1 nuclear GTPase SLIP-GC-like isoform X1 [Amphiprion ocellaris]
MADFVCNKLTEWGLSELIDRFKDHRVDEESLYDLDDQHIKDLIPEVGPRAKFTKRLKQLKEEQNTTQAAAASPVPVLPSTSDKAKKNLDLQGKSSKEQQPNIRQHDNETQSNTEAKILSDVKDIMGSVLKKLHRQDNTNLNNFLRAKIHDLKREKRELIGVFGRTGAGKSSLINAILGEKNLLPSGSVSACTSVMIKVEANIRSSKYEADIEFITPEEWKDEIWTMKQFLGNADEEWGDDEDRRDIIEKLSAVYREEWKHKSPENLMDIKYFSEIEEFLQSQRMTLTCGSAKELSLKLVKYTRSASRQGEIMRYYWPLVKCVTVKVPNNDLLQHVTLVDLPGSGDWNKSRAKMWKGIVGNCSTVWIVTEINRAASEEEAWEILTSTCSLMGNGGQCQRIHFICTKSDVIEDPDDDADVHAHIIQRNVTAKEEVIKKYGSLNQVKKHFSDDCFKVFTVSSTEFLKRKRLNPEDTEIPQLQYFLKDLNDYHSETLSYVTGAYGILSLMQGANSTEGAGKKTDVSAELEKNLSHQLGQVKKAVEDAHKAFETRLIEGVKKSQSSCERTMSSFLYRSHHGFYNTLKCVVEKDGVHKTKKGKQINLNVKLASWLTDSIDEEFRKTFPNEEKYGSFNGVISSFSLDTERLIKNNQSLKLQLIFLKTEEEKIKTKLNKIIRERKKTIYNSLTETIVEKMLDCYKRAAAFSGPDSLKYMRDTILEHVRVSKDMMFEEAKAAMLKLLNDLKDDILEKLEKTMRESTELSLKTDDNSIPDVPTELEMVKRYYNELKCSSKELDITF